MSVSHIEGMVLQAYRGLAINALGSFVRRDQFASQQQVRANVKEGQRKQSKEANRKS